MELAHTSTAITDAIANFGWVVTPPVVPPRDLDCLIAILASEQAIASERGGLRNLFNVPDVCSLAQSAGVRAVAEAVLGPHCVAVKATLFDKTPQANWKVAWHQDVTIAVRERRHVEGFAPWSEKDGTPHVQAPAAILAQMLAVRIHLDECGLENGPVRVLSGSHRAGRLSGSAIDAWRASAEPVECTVERGGILAFRPLLLHASSPASAPGHRRVVHLEFAAETLPGGLTWATEVGAPRRNE